MGWFDEQGFQPAVDPSRQMTGEPMTTNAAPAAGGGSDKGWLDWINATYGQSKARGTGFADLPAGTSLEQAIQRYNQDTGANAQYIGGPSGDRVDFGQGVTDALTAGGQLWSDYGAMSGPARAGASVGSTGGGGGAGFGGSGSASTTTRTAGPPVTMPTAPGVQTLDAPTPFSYQGLGSLGQFAAPSQTPTMAQQSYNPAATPTRLDYTNLATPEGYQAKEYAGLSAADLAADPSYQFRLQQGQQALENSAASKGVLRTGNTAKGLIDYGQGAASQEYAAADQRARATNQMNNATSLGQYQTNAQTGLAYNQNANQNALNFGQANYNQGFQTNQANNQGSNAAIAANNASALAAQGQQYGQALGGYQANLAGQQQGYNQAAGTYGMNAQNALAYNQNANQNALANYQAQTNAALGLGNLNLGYQNSANSYNLGQGNLGIQQGQLGLQQQGQGFNQGLALNQNAWNQSYQLANLGNPGAPNSQGYGQDQAGVYGQQGNAQAAGQVGSANAWGQGLANVGQYGAQAAGLYGQQPPYGYPQAGQPGYGVLA